MLKNDVIYIPPINFGYVEKGIYRSGYPSEKSFPFLQKLKIKTIMYYFIYIINLF